MTSYELVLTNTYAPSWERLASLTSIYQGVRPENHGTHPYNDRECTPQSPIFVPYTDGRPGGYWQGRPDK